MDKETPGVNPYSSDLDKSIGYVMREGPLNRYCKARDQVNFVDVDGNDILQR
jgi:hypothetical protein